MGEKRTVRPATMDDAEALHDCMVSAYTPYRDRFGAGRVPPLEVDYAAEIERFPTWIVECDGEIAGGLIMTFEPDHAVVSNVAVHPRFQGRGLGGMLMRFAEETARERRLFELRLTTHVALTANVSLYLPPGMDRARSRRRTNLHE